MNKDPVTELVRIKEKIALCEQREAEVKGRVSELLNRAKEEFGCSTKKELESFIETLSYELEEEKALLQKRLTELRSKLEEYEDLWGDR